MEFDESVDIPVIVEIMFASAAIMSTNKVAHMENYTLYKQSFTVESVQASYSAQEFWCQAIVFGQSMEVGDSVTISVCK